MEDKIGHKFEFKVDMNHFIGLTITHCFQRRFEEKKQNN